MRIQRDHNIIWNLFVNYFSYTEKSTYVKKYASNHATSNKTTAHNEEVVLIWFKRTMDVPIGGPILQAKTKQLAYKIKIKNLKFSASWIQRFGQRHNIGIGNISCESSTILKLKFIPIGQLTFGHLFEQVNSMIKCIMLMKHKINPDTTLRFKVKNTRVRNYPKRE